jgi:alpha-tubulin suppressor-like RCC1 family protein
VAVEVSAGVFHTCALLYNGSVSCWGGNSNGQLGVSQVEVAYSPQPVQELGSGDKVLVHSCNTEGKLSLMKECSENDLMQSFWN